MGNVTAGGVNDGDDDENEFYEVFIRKFKAIFGQFLLKVCLGRMTLLNAPTRRSGHLLAFCRFQFIEILIVTILKAKCII